VAQGVSSDLRGVTGDAPEPSSMEPETPEALPDPEQRKALHPIVTGSHFHQTGAATDKEEYPRLHEFGKRIKLGLPEAIPMRRVRL
jgi:hypothetical protein